MLIVSRKHKTTNLSDSMIASALVANYMNTPINDRSFITLLKNGSLETLNGKELPKINCVHIDMVNAGLRNFIDTISYVVDPYQFKEPIVLIDAFFTLDDFMDLDYVAKKFPKVIIIDSIYFKTIGPNEVAYIASILKCHDNIYYNLEPVYSSAIMAYGAFNNSTSEYSLSSCKIKDESNIKMSFYHPITGDRKLKTNRDIPAAINLCIQKWYSKRFSLDAIDALFSYDTTFKEVCQLVEDDKLALKIINASK